MAALFEAVAPDIDAMREAISLGLALGQDARLVADLRAVAGAQPGEPAALKVAASEGGLDLAPNGSAAPVATISGCAVTVADVQTRDSALMARLIAACKRTWPRAIEALRPVFEPDAVPSRQAFAAVARWAPLIMKPAYRLATRSAGVAEAMRDEALRSAPSPLEPNPEALTSYYSVFLSSAHLVLLCSPPGDGPWMEDMAKTSTGVNWSPSMTLFRERTLWLAAAAVRSAAAFGPGVIGLYLERLGQSDHPVGVCDALAGLVAIACTDEASFNRIAQEVVTANTRALSRHDPYLPFTMRAFRSAVEALRLRAESAPAPACLLRQTGWRVDSPNGLATPAAFRIDPLEPCDTGEMIGLLAIPLILQTPLLAHYPARVRNGGKLLPAPAEQVDILHRAWAPRRRTLH